jgi:hypothetical protein
MSNKKTFEKFVTFTHDYHSVYKDGFVMSADYVLDWVNQFEEKD